MFAIAQNPSEPNPYYYTSPDRIGSRVILGTNSLLSYAKVMTMTYTLKRYQSLEEFFNDEDLRPNGNYRLLSTGEAIELASEDKLNLIIAYALIEAILIDQGISIIRRLRRGDEDLEVRPMGDRWLNRQPDLVLLKPEHLIREEKAIYLSMNPPDLVAEIVSPGGDYSENYKRDYVWKRQQYQDRQIPEYWIIDPHREKITVLTLVEGEYQEAVYAKAEAIASPTFPTLQLSLMSLLPEAP